MALFSLDDLTTPLTRDQVEKSIYDILSTIGVNTTMWKPGAVVRTLIVACSVVMAAFTELTAKIARSGWLELSEGPWLTLVAKHVYNVERQLATFAEGQLRLVNTAGGIFYVDAQDLTFICSRTGKTYRNTSAFSLGALATITIPIVAVEAGSSSTASPGEIDTFQTPLTGVTCSNTSAVVGLDDEKDPSVRAKCAEKLGALSPNGPWDAYSFAARNAKRADGSFVGVTRVRTVRVGNGQLTTYVATASGAVSGDSSTPSSDVGVIDEAIQRRAAPLSVTARTASAEAVVVPVSYRVWLYNTSGLTPDAIKAAIAARLVAFFSGQPIGGNVIEGQPGRVFIDAIRTAIGSAVPQIFHVEVLGDDVPLTISQVPVLGTITPLAVTQVAPSEGSL